MPLSQRPVEAAQSQAMGNNITSDQSTSEVDMGPRIKNIEDQLQRLIQLLPGDYERGSEEPQQPGEDDGYQGMSHYTHPR